MLLTYSKLTRKTVQRQQEVSRKNCQVIFIKLGVLKVSENSKKNGSGGV